MTNAPSAMLVGFTLGWIVGCSSASPPIGTDPMTTPEAGPCPELRLAARDSGVCSLPDGASIDNVTLPSGCEGPASGGGSFDRSPFEGQPAVMVDDDDCKYRLELTRACASSSRDMSFLLRVTKRADGSTATGGTPSILASRGLAHPAPNANTMSTELEPGSYAIAPVLFDVPGTWTLELHVYEHCPYGPGSPHGHASFEVNIP